MDLSILLYSAGIVAGIVLILTGKYARWGSLIAGLGFVPLGLHQFLSDQSILFLIAGILIATLAVYRFFRPYERH